MVLIIRERYKKLIEFAKKNTSNKTYHHDDGTSYTMRLFKCPCCDFSSLNSISSNDDEWVLIGMRGYLIHLNSRIRLHASESHIEMFEELFGKENTDRFLELSLIRNRFVLNKLEEIYKRRKEMEIIHSQSQSQEKKK